MDEVKSTGSGDSIRRPDRERCFLQLKCILKVRQEQRISGVQIDTHHKSYFQIEKVIVHGYKTFSTSSLPRKQPLTKQIRSSEYMVWVCVKKFNVKKTVFGFRRGFWLVHWISWPHDLPGKTRFFSISVPVAPALMRQTRADSRHDWPWSPHNL